MEEPQHSSSGGGTVWHREAAQPQIQHSQHLGAAGGRAGAVPSSGTAARGTARGLLPAPCTQPAPGAPCPRLGPSWAPPKHPKPGPIPCGAGDADPLWWGRATRRHRESPGVGGPGSTRARSGRGPVCPRALAFALRDRGRGRARQASGSVRHRRGPAARHPATAVVAGMGLSPRQAGSPGQRGG